MKAKATEEIEFLWARVADLQDQIHDLTEEKEEALTKIVELEDKLDFEDELSGSSSKEEDDNGFVSINL